MAKFRNLPQRKSPRLPGYDYALPGAYFVTICTHQRQHIFGKIVNGVMERTPLGDVAHAQWFTIPQYRLVVDLDTFVVMPNHLHAILFIRDDPTISPVKLGTVDGNYKSAVTRSARLELAWEDTIWQGRYHDHIIRNEKSLNALREYVEHNPLRWLEDTFYS